MSNDKFLVYFFGSHCWNQFNAPKMTLFTKWYPLLGGDNKAVHSMVHSKFSQSLPHHCGQLLSVTV